MGARMSPKTAWPAPSPSWNSNCSKGGHPCSLFHRKPNLSISKSRPIVCPFPHTSSSFVLSLKGSMDSLLSYLNSQLSSPHELKLESRTLLMVRPCSSVPILAQASWHPQGPQPRHLYVWFFLPLASFAHCTNGTIVRQIWSS